MRKYADVALSILGAAVDAFNAGGAPPGQLYDTLMLAAKTIGPELAALARFAFKQTNPIFAICKAQLAAKLANLGWGLGKLYAINAMQSMHRIIDASVLRESNQSLMHSFSCGEMFYYPS